MVSKVSEPLVDFARVVLYQTAKLRGKTQATDVAGTLAKAKSVAEGVVNVEAKRKKRLADTRFKRPNLKLGARAHELACMMLKELSKSPGSWFPTTSSMASTTPGNGRRGKGGAVTVMSMVEYARLTQKHEQRRSRLEEDISLSHILLCRMVTKPQP